MGWQLESIRSCVYSEKRSLQYCRLFFMHALVQRKYAITEHIGAQKKKPSLLA